MDTWLLEHLYLPMEELITTLLRISLYTGKHGRMTVGLGIQYVNVTNTTNVKIKFTCNSLVANNYLEGHTDHNRTYLPLKDLGDSQ